MPDKTEVVCVTGATGFIASWVIKKLLEDGYSVNATVRDKSKTDKTAHLTSLPNAASKLSLFDADLTGPDGAFDEVITGCDYVLHVASPYIVSVKDPQKELVDPAVNGTLSVLKSCQKVGRTTLKKVVITSSVAAIADEGAHGRVLNEDDWNTTSTLSRNPYYFSKTLAEKAAWDFVQTESPSFDVCTINPSGVFGPSLSGGINESVEQLILAPLKGAMPVLLDLHFELVDVRDVADAHIKAMLSGKPGERYICSAQAVHFRDLFGYMKELGYTAENGYKLPTVDCTGWLGTNVMRILSFGMGDVGLILRLQLGNPVLVDNSKIRKELDVEFRPWKEMVKDTFDNLTEHSHLKALPDSASSTS
eukprot:CAMPEP_0185854450 /NCGR_PEP_ID=MMETSP1354-20130828/22427_1 /TAXON_ID=708628 /ORGANISM="Erythrolobus madagascarensis, Strain CCMP3276" /LENGTH=362 /DNA_ID=CAMNT_0028556217 /DNA_START=21 /DNA_END=1109 /DNA_ORIENTATION=+